MSQTMMKSGFLALLEQVAKERNIGVEKVVESIESAIEAALRKDRPDLFEGEEEGNLTFSVELDQNDGASHVFRTKDGERTDVTPPGFGRIASQTAKNVIFQKVREAEREAVIADFSQRLGLLSQGVVVRYDGRNAVVDLGRGQAMMPPEEQMRGEFYKPNLRFTVLIKEIRDTFKGEQVIVSRADKNLIVKLFEREVPEMASAAVEVKGIAREAGVRTKIAVFSSQPGVDPVGSCVGQRGVRVQEVIREVNNEKIDIIQYSDNMSDYLAAALAPAESLVITLDEKNKQATVVAPDDQCPLAIGRGGQNVRLAAKLTGWKISIHSASGEVKANVTGEEEYEIDQQIVGLTPELRKVLVDNRATTLDDIHRKWTDLSAKQITAEQKAFLEPLVAAYRVQLAAQEAAYAERAAKEAATPLAE
jgi:N utilization substance protein A